jgi:hypothetical protein
MKKVVLAVLVLIVAASSSVSTAAAQTDRTLTCTTNKFSAVFGICGLSRCAATVTSNGKSKTFSFKRTQSTKSITYSATNGCKIDITRAATNGKRTITKITNCKIGNNTIAISSKNLKGSTCLFSA